MMEQEIDKQSARHQNLVLELLYIEKMASIGEVKFAPALHGDEQVGDTPLTKREYLRAAGLLWRRGLAVHTSGSTYAISATGIEFIEDQKTIKSGPTGKHTGIRKPPKGTISHYIWQIIRLKKIATIEDILLLLPFEDMDQKKMYETVKRTLYWWRKAGIVTILRKKAKGTHYNSRGLNRYKLVHDLGPYHPIVRSRKGEVYDPNKQIRAKFKDFINALNPPTIDRFSWSQMVEVKTGNGDETETIELIYETQLNIK